MWLSVNLALAFYKILFSEDSLCVADLAQAVGISDQNASTQLRALSARGLITPVRKKLKVFYHPEVNTDVAHAETLLDALHLCFKTKIPTTTIIAKRPHSPIYAGSKLSAL